MERKNKFVIASWLIYLYAVLGLWFSVQAFLEPDFIFNFFKLEMVIPFFISALLIVILYFFIDRKRNKSRANLVLTISLICFFIFFTIVILYIPESRELEGIRFIRGPDGMSEESVSGTFYISVEEKIYFILFLAINLFMVYVALTILPKSIHFRKIIYLFYFLMLAYTASLFIYSLIVEMDAYANFFTTFLDKAMNVSPVPESYLGNRNFLGWVYFFTIAFSLVMHAFTKKWYHYLIGSIVFIASIPVLSKTNILSAGVLILGYLLYRYIVTVKEHKVRNTIAFLVVGGIAIWFFLSIILSFAIESDSQYLVFFKKLALTAIGFDEDLEVPTFTHRTYLWKIWAKLMNEGNYWFTGAGYGYFNILFRDYSAMCLGHEATDMPHNGFMQIIGEGGILYLVFFALLLVQLIRAAIQVRKVNRAISFITIMLIVSYFFHMVFEASAILTFSRRNIEGVMFTLLVTVPLLSEQYRLNNKNEMDEIITDSMTHKYSAVSFLNADYSVSRMIYTYLTPFLGIILGINAVNNIGNNFFIAMFITSLVAYTFLPLLINYIYTRYKDREFRLGEYIIQNIPLNVMWLALFYFTNYVYDMFFFNFGSILFINMALVLFYILINVVIKPMNGQIDSFVRLFELLNFKCEKAYAYFIKKEQSEDRTLLS